MQDFFFKSYSYSYYNYYFFFCLFVLFFKKLSGEAHFLFLLGSDWLLVVVVVDHRISVPTCDINLWRLVIKDGRGFGRGLV